MKICIGQTWHAAYANMRQPGKQKFISCSAHFFQKYPELKEEMDRIRYEDIFGELKKQIRAVRVWIRVFKIYDNEKENARNLTARNPT